MKIKVLIVSIIIVFIVFIIYILNIDKKIYYVNISDGYTKYDTYIKKALKTNNKLEKYINFSEEDYRITDLINDINNNKAIIINNKEQTIQNALIKADVLTLKMGNSELEYKANTKDINELFDYSDEIIKDIEELFKLLRLYDKEQIYFLSLYNSNSDYYNEIYRYLNLKIKDLCNSYDIKFININDLSNDKENVKIKDKVLKNLNISN